MRFKQFYDDSGLGNDLKHNYLMIDVLDFLLRFIIMTTSKIKRGAPLLIFDVIMYEHYNVSFILNSLFLNFE